LPILEPRLGAAAGSGVVSTITGFTGSGLKPLKGVAGRGGSSEVESTVTGLTVVRGTGLKLKAGRKAANVVSVSDVAAANC
jgi:hypothetical protein